MRYSLQRFLSPVLGTIALAITLFSLSSIETGCNSTSTTGPTTTTPPDTGAVMVSFRLATTAGTTPLVYDSINTAASGTRYSVSTLRFYVSRFLLLDSTGAPVAAKLVDSAGKPLKYGLTFCDYARPETQTIHILAHRGNYTGVGFSIGVPDSLDGVMLNHANASLMDYPLNVDNDMYWSWNPGYVFFKIEGKSYVGGQWQSFVYHIGEDSRLANTRLTGAFTVKDSGETHSIQVNTNKLFITPSGANVPDLAGSEDVRVVHGGVMADSMSVNLAQSGFVTLKP